VKESASLPANFEGPRCQWLAFFWGLAEATCFFIVPDALTSRMVLTNPRRALHACLASLAGALLGGALLYSSGANLALRTQLLAGMDWLPGISPDLIEKARLARARSALRRRFGRHPLQAVCRSGRRIRSWFHLLPAGLVHCPVLAIPPGHTIRAFRQHPITA